MEKIKTWAKENPKKAVVVVIIVIAVIASISGGNA